MNAFCLTQLKLQKPTVGMFQNRAGQVRLEITRKHYTSIPMSSPSNALQAFETGKFSQNLVCYALAQ